MWAKFSIQEGQKHLRHFIAVVRKCISVVSVKQASPVYSGILESNLQLCSVQCSLALNCPGGKTLPSSDFFLRKLYQGSWLALALRGNKPTLLAAAVPWGFLSPLQKHEQDLSIPYSKWLLMCKHLGIGGVSGCCEDFKCGLRCWVHLQVI